MNADNSSPIINRVDMFTLTFESGLQSPHDAVIAQSLTLLQWHISDGQMPIAIGI